jgi:glycosyltransferase involved in cell wall biosynthesis
MADGVPVSIVVCTRNRSDCLPQCLQAIVAQTLPPRHFEVIVVDNGSSDDTARVAAPFCRQHSHIHYLREERVGLSIARNTGVRASRGEIVAFTDDDAMPEPSWIERILGRAREMPADVAVIGGDVIPVFEAERPTWLTDPLLRPLSAGLKWSAEPRFLRAGEWLVEVNSAYKRAALETVGGFPENLGRVGESLLSGEGGINLLIERAGGMLYYDPAVLVRHRIPASRLTRTWFRRRMFWQGVTMNLLMRYVEEAARQLGLPERPPQARAWEEIVVPVTVSAWADLFDDRTDADFADQLERFQNLGYLLESQAVVMGR